jgi:hypothetical protein
VNLKELSQEQQRTVIQMQLQVRLDRVLAFALQLLDQVVILLKLLIGRFCELD